MMTLDELINELKTFDDVCDELEIFLDGRSVVASLPALLSAASKLSAKLAVDNAMGDPAYAQRLFDFMATRYIDEAKEQYEARRWETMQ